MNREEFSEQMHRCGECGRPMDGGCCAPSPSAFMEEREFDLDGDESGPACATLQRTFYCLSCASSEGMDDRSLTPIYKRADALNPFGAVEPCYICGEKVI